MKTVVQKSLFLALFLLLLLSLSQDAQAQCVMCSAAGEANLKEGGRAAAGLNKGILYMLSLPYIMATVIGYLWWRNRKAVAEAEREEQIDALLELHPLDQEEYSAN